METLFSGLAIGESPRWHNGRLWLSNWGAQEVLAIDLDGRAEVMASVPNVLTFSIDWLPDGRLLIVQPPEAKLLRQEADGSLVVHKDLAELSDRPWNEIVVDGRGSIYLNNINFAFGQEEFRPGFLAVLTPDGSLRQGADDLAFPNGMVVTPDNSTLIVAESFPGRLTAFDIQADGSLGKPRTWADLGGPAAGDGICMDAEGAVWCTAARPPKFVCFRVREGGQRSDEFETERGAFACMLGGEDGKTLFTCEADWLGRERMDAVIARRAGKVRMVRAPAPHAGYP
jgi:sugar lactone lactonase YvrE